MTSLGITDIIEKVVGNDPRRCQSAQVIAAFITPNLERFMTTHTTTLKITGMSCGSCVRHIDQALRAVAGVSSVTVDRTALRAHVLHQDPATSKELVAAVIAAGYDAAVIR